MSEREELLTLAIELAQRAGALQKSRYETSLTIDGLVHVVDSGFIKQTQWDPVLEQAPLLPIAHSQAGCRQRATGRGPTAPTAAGGCASSRGPKSRS